MIPQSSLPPWTVRGAAWAAEAGSRAPSTAAMSATADARAGLDGSMGVPPRSGKQGKANLSYA
ncbi:hypothetical protein GCM10018987_38560 [Streptomyces cremeus]